MKSQRLGVNFVLGIIGIIGPIAGEVSARVVINEIHYNPMERGQALEFVELLNSGTEPVDLTGWQIKGGVAWTFPPKSVILPNAHLVVAQGPTMLKALYATKALGPWQGKLSNAGEQITLCDAKGRKIDEVDYGVGFPWPTMADGGGASMELIHPDLDNDLAGSWRSSIEPTPLEDRGPNVLVTAQDPHWRYFKGLLAPPNSWQSLAFDHQKWLQGQTPIGYADNDDNTVLRDMQSRYTTVYLRKVFDYDPEHPVQEALLLRVYCDDGAVVWINEREVARFRVRDKNPTHRSLTTRNHEAAWEEILIPRPEHLLRAGKNILAILAVNGQMDSSDFSIDAELTTPPQELIPPIPTPGEPNRSSAVQPPPQVRQVKHAPKRPKPGQEVVVSAKATDPDGVGKMTLFCQQVTPGDYIHRDDARYAEQWTSFPMVGKGDDVYTATIPATWQRRRHVIRFRILAEDKHGASVQVPYADDQQPNFAYYCYDRAPAWVGADRPGRSPAKVFPEATTNALPIIHLIAKAEHVEFSQYHYAYNERFLTGTLVVGDTVYDHIRFRNRGETTTYNVGKNKWRIHFNRTRELPAAVLDNKSSERRWKRLNLNPCTVPYHAAFRGNASLNERLVFRLYQLAGSPASDTAYIHFRVVDGVNESGDDQYSGDLWGLYMAFETVDGFMLDNHGEPDSEIHRIKQSGNTIERQPISPSPPGLDYRQFWSQVRRHQPIDWWRKSIDLERYYGYHSVSLITARYDQKLNHNHLLYRHPERGWTAIPWDADLSFRPVRYDPYNLRWHPYLKNCLEHDELRIAYQNRGRELLDLLFCKDQVEALVDELVRDLGPMDQGLSFADLDHFLWNFHPLASPDHRGTFFLPRIRSHKESMAIHFDDRTFAERVGSFKDYLSAPDESLPLERGKSYKGWGYQQLTRDVSDPNIPVTPVITQSGGETSLQFHSSPFDDPQGAATFAGMRWRVGEIYNPSVQAYLSGDGNRYEVEPVWESTILTSYLAEMRIPAAALQPGRNYRIRARFLDQSGRWGHWSAPIALIATEPDIRVYQAGLLISEIMYHPAQLTDGSEGAEYIEFANIGDVPLDLAPLRLSDGVVFDFKKATIATLEPGQRVVIVGDHERFKARYPDQEEAVVGVWSSGKLSNKGETIGIQFGQSEPFLRVRYTDHEPWPSEADGTGRSLEISHSPSPTDFEKAASWRASETIGGTPGR